MLEQIKKLIDVKSFVTIYLTGIFGYLAIAGNINTEDFKLVFVMIMTYYFTKKESGTELK